MAVRQKESEAHAKRRGAPHAASETTRRCRSDCGIDADIDRRSEMLDGLEEAALWREAANTRCRWHVARRWT